MGRTPCFLGLPQLNARMRADNFSEADLPEVMAWLHARGCKGYLTLNTLVFASELQTAWQMLDHAANSGVDAVIVQDLGVAWMVAQAFPGIALHASTQMTLTSPEGLAFAERLGVKRAVLARELSLRELENFAADPVLSIEVFVHGALCVAYSGQRSANRGECAQACRMPRIACGRSETRSRRPTLPPLPTGSRRRGSHSASHRTRRLQL